MLPTVRSFKNSLDKAGIWLSSLCAVHCVLSVVIVTALGLGSLIPEGHAHDHHSTLHQSASFLLEPMWHELGLALAITIAALTLGANAVRHGRTKNLLLGTVGIILMASALMVPHGLGEAFLTIAGVFLVACAHIGNLRHSH